MPCTQGTGRTPRRLHNNYRDRRQHFRMLAAELGISFADARRDLAWTWPPPAANSGGWGTGPGWGDPEVNGLGTGPGWGGVDSGTWGSDTGWGDIGSGNWFTSTS
ncbi:hypothetical protein B0H13DRAFT_2377312 [Mycena leptocephala]|nr:hypothetical protein B0H13DRAFT_2377312 [Mycena leptocephala]